jgi:hypothetical protein
MRFRLAALALLLGSAALPGEGQAAVTFSGSNVLSGQLATRAGTGQGLPADFLRNDLYLMLNAHGIPLGARLTLSTLQSTRRQNLNRLTFFLDYRGLARSTVRSRLGFVRHFRTLELGTCRPRYTVLTLDGPVLSGVNAAFITQGIYAAFSVGRLQKAIASGATETATYQRDLAFGRLGYGEPRETHIHVSMLHAKDDPQSVPPDTVGLVTPMENLVLGLEGRLVLAGSRLVLDGEVTGSMLTRDVRTAERSGKELGIPSWLANIMEPTVSTSADYAYSLRGLADLGNTQLSGGFALVGPGYRSLGSPNLRNDRVSYDASWKQRFWAGRGQLDLFFRRQDDNLPEWKSRTTTLTAYGISASVRPPRAPYVSVQYTPHFQKNRGDSLDTKNDAHVVTLTSGYNPLLWGLRTSSQLGLSFQDNNQTGESLTGGQSSRMLTFNETVTLRIPLSLSLGLGLRSNKHASTTQDTYFINGNGSYLFSATWRAGLGFDYTRTKDRNRRTGLRAQVRGAFSRLAALELTARQVLYRDRINPGLDYDEFVLRGSLTSRW